MDVEKVIDIEIKIDDLVKTHLKILKNCDKDPYRLGAKVAYHQSYQNLYDALVEWKEAKGS